MQETGKHLVEFFIGLALLHVRIVMNRLHLCIEVVEVLHAVTFVVETNEDTDKRNQFNGDSRQLSVVANMLMKVQPEVIADANFVNCQVGDNLSTYVS
jgi:hypothetical protein